MPRALAIDWRIPTPQRDGSSRRTRSLLRTLVDLGYAVDFAVKHPAPSPPYDATLAEDTGAVRALGVAVVAGQARDHLRAAGGGYDLILLCGGLLIAEEYLADARRHAPGATIVYDTLDLHFVRQLRQAKATGSAPALRRALVSKARELATARAADRTLVVSPDELATLRAACPEARIHLVADAHRVRGDAPPFAARRDLFFVGSFYAPANTDAMLQYLDAIHPLVRAALPGVRCHVVGSDPPPELAARAAPDVAIVGYAPDLAPYFDGCRLSIAPLRYGAGIKEKVLQSLGQGVPVVCTPVAAEGLHLGDGDGALIAEGPRDFAAAVARLHEDEALWGRLSAGGRALIARHFSPATVRAQLAAALADAAPPPR